MLDCSQVQRSNDDDGVDLTLIAWCLRKDWRTRLRDGVQWESSPRFRKKTP